MDDLAQEWNEQWTSAQENNGITFEQMTCDPLQEVLETLQMAG